MENFDATNIDDEHKLEEIRSEINKKPKMTLLNQKKVNKWEMDELFTEDSYEEEF